MMLMHEDSHHLLIQRIGTLRDIRGIVRKQFDRTGIPLTVRATHGLDEYWAESFAAWHMRNLLLSKFDEKGYE